MSNHQHMKKNTCPRIRILIPENAFLLWIDWFTALPFYDQNIDGKLQEIDIAWLMAVIPARNWTCFVNIEWFGNDASYNFLKYLMFTYTSSLLRYTLDPRLPRNVLVKLHVNKHFLTWLLIGWRLSYDQLFVTLSLFKHKAFLHRIIGSMW